MGIEIVVFSAFDTPSILKHSNYSGQGINADVEGNDKDDDAIDDDDGDELPDRKGGYIMETKEISERIDEYFQKNKLMYKKAIAYLKKTEGYADAESKFTRAMVISQLKHEKAKKLLFRIIAEHIEEWWH